MTYTLSISTGSKKSKSWVAKIVGEDAKWGLKREFINQDNSTYELEDGVYNYRNGENGKIAFIVVENGEAKEIEKDEALSEIERLENKVEETQEINVEEVIEELEDEYNFVGIRFEEKEYQEGEVIADSKHNPDREDEREFPDFNSEEYEELEELPGVSTWNKMSYSAKNWKVISKYYSHVYIVVGDNGWTDEVDDCVLDDDELVIENGKVAIVLK